MTTSPSTALGWPFLVAAGRRRDYSTLLAPRFLVAELDYGILNKVAEPTTGEGPPAVIEVRTPRGRDLTIVYATHLLTAADLLTASDPVAEDKAVVPVLPPRDEHNRPLRLIYGFATPNVRISQPATTDLAFARAAALDVYRPFLENEEAITVIPSEPFPLQSVVTARPDSSMELSPTLAPAPSRPTGGGSRRTAVLLAALLGVCAVVIGVVLAIGRGASTLTPVECPKATSAAARQVTPSPSPSCHTGGPK
jgi:hypothetical protein